MVCPLNIFTLNKTFDSFLDYHWRWLKSKKNEEIRIVQCSTDFYLYIAVHSANIIRQCLPFIQLINNFCNELIVIQLFPAFHYTNNACLDFMLSVFIYLSFCLVSFWFSFPLTGTGLLNFDSMKI